MPHKVFTIDCITYLIRQLKQNCGAQTLLQHQINVLVEERVCIMSRYAFQIAKTTPLLSARMLGKSERWCVGKTAMGCRGPLVCALGTILEKQWDVD